MTTELYHDHESDALPQAAPMTLGRYLESTGRTVRPYDQKGAPNDKALVLVSKTGPAFDAPLATDLARSLQAQGVAACGDLLSAISRKCWPDIMAAWPRVISTLNLKVSHVPVVLSQVDYERMAHTVIVAMGAAQDITAAVKWQHVDTVLRSSAAEWAQAWAAEARAVDAAIIAGEGLAGDNFYARECHRKAAEFRAFAEGRS